MKSSASTAPLAVDHLSADATAPLAATSATADESDLEDLLRVAENGGRGGQHACTDHELPS